MQVETHSVQIPVRIAPFPQPNWVEVVEGHENGPIPVENSVLLEKRALPDPKQSKSEASPQRITIGSMQNSHQLYIRLTKEGEEILEQSYRLKAEAELKHGEAQKELECAENTRAEANAYFEKIIEKAQAKKEAADTYQEKLLGEVHQQIGEELAEVENSRVEADSHRERVISKAQQQAEEIVNLAKTAAEEIRQQAEEKLGEAENSRVEADSHCEGVISEAQQQAEEIVNLAKTAAEEIRQQAEEKLGEAENSRVEADSHRVGVISEAKQQAEEIINLAKTAAEREGNTIKEKLVQEAQKALARLAQTASQAEMEAQKLYTDAASLEAISKEALTQAEAQLGQRLPVEELEEISSEPVSKPAPRKRKGWLKN